MKVLIGLCLVALAAATTCPFNGDDWKQDSGYFLDCLTDSINSDVDDIKTVRPQRKDELISIFSSSPSCKSYFTKKVSTSSDTSVDFSGFFSENSDFMKIIGDERLRFFTSTADVAAVKEAVGMIQDLIWNVLGPKTQLSACLIEFLRSQFFVYMRKCLTNHLGEEVALLDPARNLKASTPNNLKDMQQFVEMYIKAYLVLKYCDEKEVKSLIKKMTSSTDQKVCKCAKDSFYYCKENYAKSCPEVDSCVLELIDNPGLFLAGLKTDLKSRLGACFNDDGKELFSEVIRKGLAIFAKIRGMDQEQKTAFGKFVKTILDAHFQPDFCSNCQIQ